MMKKYFLTAICLLLTFTSFSQETKSIESFYTSYFENTREIPYLHLNKTTFLEGEEIWFQGYVLEQNSKKLHPTTSNLYVSIFDDEGKLKDQQLIHIKEGLGSGSIYLDSTYTKEYYYLKASTNWMRNFKEDNSFAQEVRVLSNKRKTIVQTNSEEDFFDFQIFPESGYFLEDLTNNAGILIKDKNGKGQKITKGILKEVDSEKILSNVYTNNFGLGKLTFLYQKNKKYVLEVTLANGSVIKKTLPTAKQKGVVMQVKNQNTKFLEISLLANKETLKNAPNLDFKIWIHNTNTYYKNTISINKKELVKTLFIKNSKLAKGINIITVFDSNNTPLLERLVYNHDSNLLFEPKITSKTIAGDSIATIINNPTNKRMYVSASFLPIETKAYKPDHNIVSNFILKPFIKGNIQNASYYFENINNKKLNELDLLLLTQGWSKYNWKNIFNKPPTTDYAFENGIDLYIKMNSFLKKKQSVLMYSKANNLIREFKSQSYNIRNHFFEKNSEIVFALKQNDNLSKFTPILSYSKSSMTDYLNIENKSTKNSELVLLGFGKLNKGREVLNEVVIKTKKKYANEPLGIAKIFKTINLKSYDGASLTDIIKRLAKEFEYSKYRIGSVYLNSRNINTEMMILYSISMEEIREIRLGNSAVDKNKELHIYTYSKEEFNDKKIKSLTIKIPIGFAKEKEYYEPKYPDFSNETFKNYGALSWKALTIIEPNSNTIIKISNYEQKSAKLHIEGISEDGRLISKEELLENKLNTY